MHYTVEIKWSDDDQTFVVFLPEWEGLLAMPCTDGKTYAEAAEHAQEVIESMVEMFQEDGKPLPEAKTYVGVE